MTQAKPRGLSADPMLKWTQLAVKTAEMMLASAQVIGHRTARMAGAGLAPGPKDQQEFLLMGHEKLEAAAESAHAMAEHLLAMNHRLWEQTSAGMLSGTTAMLSFATNPSLDQQAGLVELMNLPARNASTLAGSAPAFARRALKPIHAKATANARRLGGR